MPRPRAAAAVLAVLALALSATGCVSMANGGPVQSYSATQGASAQGQSYLQLIPKSPVPNGTPTQIVRGFLTASASFADGQRVAKEFLMPAVGQRWSPTWSATVFSGNGPQVDETTADPANPNQATVTVSGDAQAKLSASGAYAVPSASGTSSQSFTFHLVKSGGQWRIVNPPPWLLLTSVEFTADYQLRNLYFLDPSSHSLVPDPVYVPLQATPASLLNGLVKDLINPPGDWLAGATHSAFPRGTKLLSDVVVNGGAAEVNLGGTIARLPDVQMREQVSAQLLSTLSGSGQGQPLVRSVVLAVNGKAWSPPQTQQNPVQHSAALQVPTGDGNSKFYYLDQQGTVWAFSGASGDRTRVQRIGPGYSSLAVSPDRQYLAVLSHGHLFTSQLGGNLVERAGSGYTTISWDASHDLWATENGQVVMLPGVASAQPGSSPGEVGPIDVVEPSGVPETSPITAVRIAPDGVRVAFVIGKDSQTLAFGAIVRPSVPGQQSSPRVPAPVPQITLAPFSVSGGSSGFSAVSWYGPDNVITVGRSTGSEGPALTEYSVNGGQTTSIPTEGDIQSVTTSSDSLLIAGTKGGTMLANASTSGAWTSIGPGAAPVYPG